MDNPQIFTISNIFFQLSLLILLIFHPYHIKAHELVNEDFESPCALRCPLQQNKTEENFDIGCGVECKIKQCSKGCHIWRVALKSSCHTACNGTQNFLGPKEFHCVVGCNDALSHFFQRLKEEIGIPPAPYLVPDTLTATSLSLAWDGVKYSSDISYLVQWRYEEHNGGWQYCHNQTWGARRVVFVENLQPYTKYRFRIALLLSSHFEPVVSEPSVVISTLAEGVPTSPPIITRTTPIDSRRISISWKPGPFPNGPLHSYVLELTGEFTFVKEDIAASENADFYMFQNLRANSNYQITLTMRNAVGEGPPATVDISTPSELQVKEKSEPVLILVSKYRISKQNVDMLGQPTEILSNEDEIKGIAIDLRKNWLFMSNSYGFVSLFPLNSKEPSKTILSEDDINFLPFDLSVDWLNNHLYILGETIHSDGSSWQISRCGYDGKGLTVAVAGITVKPLHIEVDPYNGYLFWVIQGYARGGLYRLDLANISNGIKHEVIPDIVMENPHLGAFTVDHSNFCILVPDHRKNTIFSVSLDGRDVIDIRSNTQQPLFKNVTSLTTANGLFYWTNGEEVFTEDFHEGHNTYFHNHYPGLTKPPYIKVFVNLLQSQPIPVPVNPPIHVQAVFGGNVAKISWQLPHLVGGQGKGAWQNWFYELYIKQQHNGFTIIQNDITNSTSCSIAGLDPNEEYIVKAQAYTSAGSGPWSREFVGKTLEVPENGQYPKIFWSGAEGVFVSDVTGDDVEMVISNNLKESNEGSYHYIDISWFEDEIYLVTNTSNLHWHNTTTHETGSFAGINSVGSIAIDWMGKKIYWSNSKQQLIFRKGIFDEHHEPLPILTVAKELEIDSEQAFIYWSTGHGVECARLNGDMRKVYYPAQLFSGKQIMGLTLNFIDRFVYWIVQGSEGNILYKAPLANGMEPKIDEQLVEVARFDHPVMQSPMSSFGNNLLWLRDQKNAVVSDAQGLYIANFRPFGLSDLYMVDSKDTYRQKLGSNIIVLPKEINITSIEVVGFWPKFNITWEDVDNVNYGDVFYEVTIISDLYQTRHVVHEPLLHNEKIKELPPYTKLEISVRAFTYWGSSQQVRKVIFSPPSRPTEPENVRSFVITEEGAITIVLRWDAPKQQNGIITGYGVKCWHFANHVDESTDLCGNVYVGPDRREFLVQKLTLNTTLNFKVQAFTIAGEGAFSKTIVTNTSALVPIPALLFTTKNRLGIVDMDSGTIRTLAEDMHPLDITWNNADGTVFWINDLKEIIQIQSDGTNKTKIHDLNTTGLSLTIDWIGKYVYWSELEEQNSHSLSSSIYRLDLCQLKNEGKSSVERIIRRSRRIHQIKISPFLNSLFWIEVNRHGAGHLMTSSSDGSKMHPVFSVHIEQTRKNCSCSENPRIGHTFSLDQQDPLNPLIFYRDDNYGYIYETDVSGCNCKKIGKFKHSTSEPSCISTNHHHLFWSNQTEGKIFASDLSNTLQTIHLPGVEKILAIGSHLQPFPPLHCLVLGSVPGKIEQLESTSQTITLQLPVPERPTECENISMSSIRYTVFYGRISEEGIAGCEDNIKNCEVRETYHKLIRLTGLKPFSSYISKITMNNYYSAQTGEKNEFSSTIIVKTSAGAPSLARNVTAYSTNPNTIHVLWLPPEEFNDRAVWYEVHWKIEGMVGGVRQSGDMIVEQVDTFDTFLATNSDRSVSLKKLFPGQVYQIWVRTYSQNSGEFSETSSIDVKTLPHPNNITLLRAEPQSLALEWTWKDKSKLFGNLEYYDFNSGEWQKIDCESDETPNIFIVRSLSPKSTYLFRSVTMYQKSEKPYVWPMDARFTFETKGDRPSQPGTPMIQHIRRGVYQVVWDLSKENGASIELYLLEYCVMENWRKKRKANYTNDDTHIADETHWTPIYNGTENYWIVTDLSPSLKYLFRVKAKNIYGWSDPSETSQSFDYTEAAILANQQEYGVVLGITLPISLLICVVGFILFWCVYRKRDKEKKELQVLTLNSSSRGPDVELATLRELPQRGNFITNANQLYASSEPPTTEEISLLPHIPREHFKLTKFLGRGAFGEVYEGIIQGAVTHETIKVAIKALRKGASEQEQIEFIKEAQLMSHFKHKHILQLLAVCLNNDPNYILMELMEGGDLLSYLRANRLYSNPVDTIFLLDLYEMCIDVAEGCCYLEDMHFVHRDLACRNCLVSSKDKTNRIVKIGDFGLARDIYKNDYYRKEGEGLLPVRWMAPESLVDGIFTTQSDVWSFGVLLWEILTMGQQPYPARTNIEVLHYVRNGGRLGRPSNCSEQLHNLMMKCWNFNPEHRPTFKYCLETLQVVRDKTLNGPCILDNGGDYLEIKPDSKEGNPEFLNCVHNTVEHSEEPHKYLQLLYDENLSCPREIDGYEIPSSTILSRTDVDQYSTACVTSSNSKHLPPDISTIEKLLCSETFAHSPCESGQNSIES